MSSGSDHHTVMHSLCLDDNSCRTSASCSLATALQTPHWYMTNYPDGPNGKVLGFLDYHIVYALQLDHIYTSSYFLGVSLLLAASLVACSRTQQWPLVKIARRWKFAKTPSVVFAKGHGARASCWSCTKRIDAWWARCFQQVICSALPRLCFSLLHTCSTAGKDG
jgi:ResB-like family